MHHWKQKVFCRNSSNFTSQLGFNKICPANKILRFVFWNNKHITMEYLCSNIKVSFFTNCYSSYIWLLLKRYNCKKPAKSFVKKYDRLLLCIWCAKNILGKKKYSRFTKNQYMFLCFFAQVPIQDRKFQIKLISCYTELFDIGRKINKFHLLFISYIFI